MAAATICSDFRAQEEEICHCFHCLPFYLPWSDDGTRCHDLSFFILGFKPALSLFSFTLIKKLFISSSLSAIRGTTYLRSLMFLLPVLIPACNLSSPAFLVMCSVYRLNKQQTALSWSFLNSEPISCYISSANCCFLTHIQVSQETHEIVWYYLFKSFPQFVMIHTVESFSTVIETEVDVFLEFCSIPYDPVNVGNLISGSSAFFKPSWDIWKFFIHIMLMPSVQDFRHNLTSMGDDCNFPMVKTFFSTILLGNWDED